MKLTDEERKVCEATGYSEVDAALARIDELEANATAEQHMKNLEAAWAREEKLRADMAELRHGIEGVIAFVSSGSAKVRAMAARLHVPVPDGLPTVVTMLQDVLKRTEVKK